MTVAAAVLLTLAGCSAADDGDDADDPESTATTQELYYFAQDAAAGDVSGQGVSDVWWVLDATGAPIRD